MPIDYARSLTGTERTQRTVRHLGLALAFVAGAANAGAYLAVKRYTSHMTGIVSSIADNLALGELGLALGAVGAVVAFLLGAMTSAVMINFGRRRQARSAFALPLMLEALLFLLFGVMGATLAGVDGFFVPATVAVLCFTMGLQNAVITKISGSVVRTTHLTGVITDLGIEMGKWAYWNRTPSEQAAPVVADRARMVMLLSLVLAFLGGGILGVLTTWKSAVEVRQVPLGNLLFKAIAVAIAAPLAGLWAQYAPRQIADPAVLVVTFHVAFNIAMGLLFIGFTAPIARVVVKLLPKPDPVDDGTQNRPNHLDPSALSTPSLAIACAAREALHQADVVETMLRGLLPVIKRNDLRLAHKLRQLDDAIDNLYSSIKYYLTKLSRESLDDEESRRWADIISFTINMEQIGDAVERVLLDIENKKIKKGRSFSADGMAEITDLHSRLLDNLRLCTSVFLNGNLRDAKRLLEEKARFRELQITYADKHLTRLEERTPESIETSALHLEVIGEFKRINSHICAIAYPILESAGALHPTRLRPTKPAELLAD